MKTESDSSYDGQTKKYAKKKVNRWTEDEHQTFLEFITLHEKKGTGKRESKFFVKMASFMKEKGFDRNST